MEKEFNILRQNRKNTLRLIENLSLEQLNIVPKGFNNNIAWNVAHLVVTHQLLCYKLAGLPTKVDDEMINLYRKGTKPERDMTQVEFDNVKELFVSLIAEFEQDFQHGIFKNYNEYPTSANVTLTCIEDAISFNNFHEGIHFGSILALRKLV